MELPENCSRYLSKSWNQFDKLLGVRSTGMQSKVVFVFIEKMELHEEVEKNSKTEYPYLLVDVF